ncbi:glycosyltransferase family 4 protein [Nocardia salmonicida]|uniref:glycosyltransferase family 4 protein n=1 Tax=Nocardia salmonicida TaxID=53431 RepID=UPI0007A475BC|nr:glycosyltransferase family 4 protein [Nocardia salmonicida]
MTRAVFLAHTAAPSGAELATLRLLDALRATGRYQVTMIYTEDGPMVARMRARDIETRVVTGRFDSRAMRIGTGVLGLLTGFVALLRLGWAVGAVVAETRADVVVAESTKALVLGAVAARRARVPLVWQVHDRVSPDYFGAIPALAIRVLARLVCRGQLANSRATAATLPAGLFTAIAYPGVELPATPADPRTRSAAEAVVVVVGRLSPWKGQDVFLRAIAALRVRPARVVLVGGTFFGEETYRAQLEKLAAELGVAAEFTGHVDDPTEYLTTADILVHCSVLPEPFGQVVVEGMAAGCAVVAATPGGPAEIIDTGVDGLLVPGGDVGALTAALDTLLHDPADRARLALAGRDRARDFDIHTSARTVADFLDTMVTRGD